MSTTDDTPPTSQEASHDSGQPAPSSDTAAASGTAAASPAAPGFGLVFQAPDLSELPARKPRGRRESEPEAQPDRSPMSDEPDTSPDSAESSPDSAGSSRSADQGDQGDQESGEGGSSETPGEGGPSKGRRRKRGGKGRGRGRGRSGEADSGSSTEPSSTSEGESDGKAEASAGDDRGGQGAGEDQPGTAKKKKGGGSQGSKSSSQEGSSGSQESETAGDNTEGGDAEGGGKRRRRRRRSESSDRGARDEVTGVRGSTRLEAKRQRRREGREGGRRRTVISEAEFLARRESVDRVMVVRGMADRTQIGVLEDGVLVEHYVSRDHQSTSVGNVYLGRVQNVLPSMEAAFVDIGKGRNAVLYAGEVNWDAAGLEVNQAKRIENALTSGESVLVQVTKDPIGHKGARLTSQVSLPGRFLVYVPGNSMTGISRKLPDTERARLKKILKEIVPDEAGVIVRTAAEGASEADLRADVERLTALWEEIRTKSESKAKTASGPVLLHSEPDMTVRVIRDVFNEDFAKLIVSGEQAWTDVSRYIDRVAPDLRPRVEQWSGEGDVFTELRVTEALAKAMERKVWLPSGGSLVIDRTEAMTVVDVNTGKFVGSGGNLEETVTKNNIEAAEEIVRQLRLRDIGGIIVIDFIDMVLESNRDLVVRRLLECLGRDRTKHQVAEVTSLGLVQMTRKRVGAGLVEVFSEPCSHCAGRGIIVHAEPVEVASNEHGQSSGRGRGSRKSRGTNGSGSAGAEDRIPSAPKAPSGPTAAQIAAAAHAAAVSAGSQSAEAPEPHPGAAPGASPESVDVDPDAAPDVDADVDTGADAAVDGGVERSAEVVDAVTDEAAGSFAQDAPMDTAGAVEAQVPAATAAADHAGSSDAVPEQQRSPEPVSPPRRPRRTRGRVVVPAGPPTGAASESES